MVPRTPDRAVRFLHRWTLPFVLLLLAIPLRGDSCHVASRFWGVLPFYGATNVPTSGPIRFVAPLELPHDMPAIPSDAGSLWISQNGQPTTQLEVTFVLDREANAIDMYPKEPLQPNQSYFAYGIDLRRFNSANYWMPDMDADPACAEFFTGSRPYPALVTSSQTSPSVWTVYVVFSEEMDDETLTAEGAVSFQKADGTPLSAEYTGRYQGAPSIHTWTLGTKTDESVVLIIQPTVLSTSGEGIDGDGDGTPGEPEDTTNRTLSVSDDATSTLQVYLGAPHR